MNTEFVIKSNGSDRILVFRKLEKNENVDEDCDYFQVELRGSQVTAIAKVSARNWSMALNDFFQELGQLEKPWNGKKTWKSVGDVFSEAECHGEAVELSLGATCNKIGHVAFDITMQFVRNARYNEDREQVEQAYVYARLAADFGTMSSIAQDAQKFFGEK